MNTEEYSKPELEASEKLDSILSTFSNRFRNEISDLDAEPERERICLLEDMIHEARVSSDSVYLEFSSKLIDEIDEEELIARKKSNIKRKG